MIPHISAYESQRRIGREVVKGCLDDCTGRTTLKEAGFLRSLRRQLSEPTVSFGTIVLSDKRKEA